MTKEQTEVLTLLEDYRQTLLKLGGLQVLARGFSLGGAAETAARDATYLAVEAHDMVVERLHVKLVAALTR